jgi:5'-3' exonuclease
MNKNILVDGNNLLHRANAIYEEVVHKNQPVGLIHSVLTILSDWILSMDNIQHIAFFMDGTPTRRRALYPGYKVKKPEEENKKSLSNTLSTKLTFIELSDGHEVSDIYQVLVHVLCLLGIDVYHNADEEADDLIASYIKVNPKDLNIIVSSDTDFYPLLNQYPTTVIYRPGIQGNRFFDVERAEEHLLKKYKVRVPLTKIELFKSLTGDASDKITGVPHLRKKVAAGLCNFDSIDRMIEFDLPGTSKAEKEKIITLKEKIELNLKLIKLLDDINIESTRIPAYADFKLADLIIKNDIGLYAFPTYAFQLSRNPKIRISDAINIDPDYEWLRGI